MQNIARIATIISVIIFTLKAAVAGSLSPETAFFLLISGLVIAFAKGKTLAIAFGAVGLYLFIQSNAAGSAEATALLGHVLALALVIYGVFIMFRGWGRQQ